MIFKCGSLYSILYKEWKTNPTRIYCFVLYDGLSYLHCLQLGARQLSQINRMKLIRIISQLSKLPMATKWNGRQLYAIFKRYAPDAVRQCYRKFIKIHVTTSTLVNYGLNKKEEFLDIELKYVDKNLFNQAKKDIIINTLAMFNKKGVQLSSVSQAFAKPTPSVTAPTIATKVGNESAPVENTNPQTNETASPTNTGESNKGAGAGEGGGPRVGGTSSSINIEE